MSQVKKLLQGASVPKFQSGGKYNIVLDGQTFTLDDEQLNEINNEIASLDPRHRMFLGGASNTIKSGGFNGNRAKNTVSSSVLSNLTDKDLNYLKAGKSSRWEAISDSNTYKAKEAINELLNIVGRVASTKPADNRTKLGSDVVVLDYNTDKEGKRYLSPINYSAKNRVNNILEHLQLGDQSKYNTEGWDFSNISSWLNGLEGNDKYDAARKYFDKLWGTMGKPGFDTAKDYNSQDVEDLLNMFRIKSGKGDETGSGSSVKSDGQKGMESDFTNNPGLYDLLGETFKKDKDGVWRLQPGMTFNPGIQLAPNQGIWFNDDFYNSPYGLDTRLAPLKGLTYYNGALYKLDDPTLNKILNIEGGYNERMQKGDWSGADNIILTRFTEGARNNPSFLDKENYSTFLSDPNRQLMFIDRTGLQRLKGDTEEGNQVIQYVDLMDPSSLVEGNPYRRYNYKWALLDNRGGFKRDLEESEIEDIANGATRDSGLLTYKRINDPNNKDYNNKYYEDILDKNGEASGFRFYYNPNDANDIILHMPRINAQDSSSKDLKLPKEVAEVLMNGDRKWLEKVVGNKQAQGDFIEVMSHLVQKWHARNDANGLLGSILGMNDRQKLSRIFDNEAEVNSFLTALDASIKGKNAKERRGLYYTSSPRLERLGGILKQQNGGRAGGTTSATGVTEKRVNAEAKNTQNAAGITQIGSDNWDQNDTLDVIALLGDLGSLGAAFVPGANVASAGIGAASSSARFAANKGHGTKGAGLNYALDLGMDAATLLPFLGAGAKGAKTVKAIKNALPTIIKAASVYGLGSAVVNSATKIANGEDWTPKDVSVVVNALTAGIGLSRQGGLGRNSKTTKTKAYSENLKIGDKEISLSDSEIRSIMKSSDQAKELRNAIKSKAPNATDKEIANAAEGLLKEKRTLWQRLRKKDGDLAMNVAKKPIKKTEAVESTGNRLVDWWRGTGDAKFEQTQYNRQLRGHNQLEKVSSNTVKQEIVVPESTTPGLIETSVPAVVRRTSIPYTRYQANLRAPGIALPQFVYPYTKANYQGNKNEQPAGLVYESYKKGGKIEKVQYGTKFDPNWKPGTLKIDLDEWQNPYEKPLVGDITMGQQDIFTNSVKSYVPESYKIDPSIVSEKPSWYTGTWDIDDDTAGGYNKNISDYSRYISPALSLLRYGLNAAAQRKDRDLEKQKARASIHPIYPHQFSGPNQNNPIFDRQRNDIEKEQAAGLLNRFVTSDAVQNFGLWQSNQNRFDLAKRDLLSKESAFTSDVKDKTIQAHDQTNNAAADAATEMRAQLAAAKMAEIAADQMLNQRKAMSQTNYLMELQNNVAQDRQKLLAYGSNEYNNAIDKQFEANLKLRYPEATKAYYNLSIAERDKYSGLEDYISRTIPGAVDWIAQQQETSLHKKLEWQKNNMLNYNYGPLMGKKSSIGLKKGGRLNGRTRYTKEPDEQIWIDNNKAAHNAVAKLSDQNIKLLLRALK